MASGAARPGGTATHASRSTARPWTILVGSGFLTGISHRTERARCCIRPPPSDHDVRTARLVAGRDYGLRYGRGGDRVNSRLPRADFPAPRLGRMVEWWSAMGSCDLLLPMRAALPGFATGLGTWVREKPRGAAGRRAGKSL
jgi:hypothetical protein